MCGSSSSKMNAMRSETQATEVLCSNAEAAGFVGRAIGIGQRLTELGHGSDFVFAFGINEQLIDELFPAFGFESLGFFIDLEGGLDERCRCIGSHWCCVRGSGLGIGEFPEMGEACDCFDCHNVGMMG
jgi:hypothetical protein